MWGVAAVLVGLIAALISGRVRASHAFVIALVALYLSGEVTQEVVLSNVTNHSVITLLLLLLSSMALERTALLGWASKLLSHQRYGISLLRLGVVSALSSAFLNNTAVVATLTGTVLKNPFHTPKKMLIPLSYFSILGGTLTLIGTATNLVISSLLEAQGLPALAVFDFFPVGGCLLVGCGLVLFISAYRLPKGEVKAPLAEGYFLDAEVLPDSKLVGKSVVQNGLRALDGLFLVEIIRDGALISPVTPSERIYAGDKLLFSGDVSQVKQLMDIDGLALYVESEFALDRNLVEVLVSPESILIGRTLKDTEFRSRFDAAVVAISRQGKRLSGKLGECVIQSGDKLVLAVGDDFRKRPNLTRNFFLLSDVKVKNGLSKWQNIVGIGGFLVSVIVAATTEANLIDTLGLYLVVTLSLGITDSTQLRRRFPFELMMILVSALCIASAFSSSGLASALTETFQSELDTLSLHWILFALIAFTTILTELMTNTAAAAIVFPIAIATANVLGVSYLTLVMAVAYGASASFISPFGYQTNLMVMNAGNYTIKDFAKFGWLITLTYIAIATFTIPYFFPF